MENNAKLWKETSFAGDHPARAQNANRRRQLYLSALQPAARASCPNDHSDRSTQKAQSINYARPQPRGRGATVLVASQRLRARCFETDRTEISSNGFHPRTILERIAATKNELLKLSRHISNDISLEISESNFSNFNLCFGCSTCTVVPPPLLSERGQLVERWELFSARRPR